MIESKKPLQIREFCSAALFCAEAHGFDHPRSIKEVDKTLAKLSLIHSEVSEAVEAVRKQDKPNMGEELADVVIRSCNLAAALGIDLEAEIIAKHEKNLARPYRHGGKAA